jgi:hypothetical protein
MMQTAESGKFSFNCIYFFYFFEGSSDQSEKDANYNNNLHCLSAVLKLLTTTKEITSEPPQTPSSKNVHGQTEKNDLTKVIKNNMTSFNAEVLISNFN